MRGGRDGCEGFVRVSPTDAAGRPSAPRSQSEDPLRRPGQALRQRARALALSPRLPFEMRCQLLYRMRRRSWPTRQPVSFNEKQIWKLAKDRRPLLTTFADKVAVRDYVARVVGPDVLTELYAVVTDPTELDLAELPDQFVVKPNHASGLIWIVVDRLSSLGVGSGGQASTPSGTFASTWDALDWDLLVDTCRGWLGVNYADVELEWWYRNIPPQILVEELLLDPVGQIPPDYKFYVFDGRVQLIEVHTLSLRRSPLQSRSPRLECGGCPIDLSSRRARTAAPRFPGTDAPHRGGARAGDGLRQGRPL